MKLLLQELNDPRTELLPITTERYHEMIRHGLVAEGDPYELLDGAIVRKDRSARGGNPMGIGNEHVLVVQKLNRLDPDFRKRGCHVRIQQPVEFPPIDEPEPDVVIAVGTEDDYHEHHPGVDDILCLIEVADSSLRRDRTTKLKIYARAGVRRYMIINLPDRIVETFAAPNLGTAAYERTEVFSSREKVTFPTAKGAGITVAVKSLLPPPPKSRSSNGRH